MSPKTTPTAPSVSAAIPPACCWGCCALTALARRRPAVRLLDGDRLAHLRRMQRAVDRVPAVHGQLPAVAEVGRRLLGGELPDPARTAEQHDVVRVAGGARPLPYDGGPRAHGQLLGLEVEVAEPGGDLRGAVGGRGDQERRSERRDGEEGLTHALTIRLNV